MTVNDALDLIIAKSPGAAQYAIDAKRALAGNTPTVTRRINTALKSALNDPLATLADADRTNISEALRGSNKVLDLRVRVSPGEKRLAEHMATAAGFKTLSDFIRHKIGL